MDKQTVPTPKASLPQRGFEPNARGPLSGLRVVDLARLVAGNMLSLQLADFGAEVIKVEPKSGDTLRAFQTDGVEAFWKAYCRNKKSISLDFRHPETIEIIRTLVRTADVMTESFRPGVLEEMGLGPDALHAINPKLVIARISGWGQTGPYSNKPGFGTLVEGYSGFSAMNGFQDREPVLPPMFLGDMTAGLYGVSAVMTALWEVRVNGGQGQVIDVSLFEPILSILGPQIANYRLTGKVKARTGSRSSTTAPRNTYRTVDGQWLCVSSSTQTMAARLFQTIGRDDMNTDPRYSTNAARLKHIEEVDGIVSEFISQRTLSENLEIFERAEVTVGPVHDASALISDAFVIERESVIDLEDAELGRIPVHNVVPRLSKTPGNFFRPAPHRGEHNEALLVPLLGQARYTQLIEAGAIVPASEPKTTRRSAANPAAANAN
jgi:formyl-CoA transferase